MSAHDLPLFGAEPPPPRVKGSDRVLARVDASHLGRIVGIVVTEAGAEIMCAGGTLQISAEQYFEFVKFRKSPATAVNS